MSTEFDTSWFNLKNYDRLRELNLSEWQEQIEFRLQLYLIWEFCNSSQSTESIRKEYEKNFKRMLEHLKTDPIIKDFFKKIPCLYEHRKGPKFYRFKYKFNATTVYSACAEEIRLLGTTDELNHIWDYVDLLDRVWSADLFDEEKEALINTPIDVLLDNKYINYGNVTVDLNATDEQIINDFSHWLTEYRKFIGYQTKRKIFCEKDFSEWVQWRLIPYFDLKIAAFIEKNELTQSKAANLIFFDEYDVGIVDRLRRTTIPKAKWLISDEVILAMRAQLDASVINNS
jgi:hypothetical protein